MSQGESLPGRWSELRMTFLSLHGCFRCLWDLSCKGPRGITSGGPQDIVRRGAKWARVRQGGPSVDLPEEERFCC